MITTECKLWGVYTGESTRTKVHPENQEENMGHGTGYENRLGIAIYTRRRLRLSVVGSCGARWKGESIRRGENRAYLMGYVSGAPPLRLLSAEGQCDRSEVPVEGIPASSPGRSGKYSLCIVGSLAPGN